ncbi:tRNA-splicing endonuclease-like protein [Macrophomina phaseolina]|uniref:tRNA-splicing endonuclease-like protein n=1 Tax=Macrophomina phaseolina TaxID=35725 RepID=A0ABQ8GDF6_9PEZI|nr:tRNA-splicing endonuclease-like protein [Macrophomina phaseolina]
MGEVLVNKLNELKALPEDLHLFCPRNHSSDAGGLHLDEDLVGNGLSLEDENEADRQERHKKLAEAEARKNLVLDCLPIFAFDGADAAGYQEWLKEKLNHAMTTCDVCIRIYHRARNELKHKLEEDYDSDEVTDFMRVFDNMNLDRITAGLDHAAKLLREAPEEKRGVAALDNKGMFSLFESLSCEALLKNELLLAKHLDEPFDLIQTRKRLRLNNYTPAMTRFLFSTSENRYFWAKTSWEKFKRDVTKTEFAAAVRDPLFDAMKRVQLVCLDAPFLPSFWRGVRIIVDKLDKELITHSLRAIEIDVCKLSLEHLQFEFDGFKDLMATVRQILQKSAVDFWDAMGAISPVTVIEQIMGNKTLEQILLRAEKQDASEASTLDEVFGWVKPFFDSIKPTNQTPACRALVHQLLSRCQEDRYSRASRAYCYELGLKTLLQSLRRMNTGSTRATFVGYATVSDMLDFVNVHIEDILATIRVNKSLNQDAHIVELGLLVVQYTLSLDCLSLEVDKEALARGEQLHHDMKNELSPVWDTIIKSIYPGDIELATKALTGAGLLVGMEPFVVKSSVSMSRTMTWWNDTFTNFSKAVTSVLEKLSDFSPNDLHKLFESRDASHAVIIHLFASESEQRQAAVEVVKAVSSEDSRRDALAHIVKSFYFNALRPIEQSLRRISKKQVFAPMSNALKLSSDVVDVLCNPQDGLLRSRSLTSEEAAVTEQIWATLWQTLMTIFEKTEDWSNVGHDKTQMMDFCRDTMQFADALYDEYSHFASALKQAGTQDREKGQDIAKKLLKNPQITMGGMSKWLRLRDEYLIAKSIALTCKLLVRLGNAHIDVEKDTRLFIEEVLEGKVRTKLTPNQKAQLEEALEKHLGYSIRKEEKVPKKVKQGSISAWATSGTGKPSPSSSGAEETDTLRKVLDDQTTGAAAWKARQKAIQEQAAKIKKPTVLPDRSEFMKQREREKAEAQRKKLEALQRQKKSALIGVAAQTAEAGAAARGIGVAGKDHSVKGEGVMVSSDESESDEEDEIDEELFGSGVKRERVPKAKLPLLPQGPVKKKRVQRSFKDMRARLAPDLGSLHRTILSWDYFHDGDYPPNSRPDIYSRVPNKFQSPFDYKNIFQPLLTLEAWQGFVKAREEGTFKPFDVKVVNRSNVDNFIELSTNMSHADNKEISISEGDICLLSKAPQPATTSDAPNCLARVYRITRKKAHLEVLYRLVHGSALIQSLVPNATVYGVKIQSITPLEREYGALVGLQYYDLCDEIIKAKPSPLLNYNDKQLEPFKDTYNLNRAQAKAVKSAIDNDAFTLIQGPPGSGKTKTIVAIVGALLTDSLKSGGGTVISTPAGMNNAAARNNLPAPKKLLVCAPSNAAVDELVMRFKEGIKTTSGQHKKISVVRLGRSDAMNANVKDVTLDELVNARLNINPEQNGDQREETGKVMKEHQAVSERLRNAREKLDSGEVKGDELSRLKDEFDILRRQKAQLSSKIDECKDREASQGRMADLNRKRAQQAILDESHVICATLSGSGHEMFQNLNIEFETVVVDEAAQCVEMSALIPLKYGCAKAILVGDPKQLPPTVFSKEAARFQYEQSLFVRMQTNHPNDVHLLDTQYRMHPEISYFPSQTFYDGRLLDGADMAALREKPWHSSTLLAPYRFFDVQGQHQSAPKGHSLINIAEIDVAMALYSRLMNDFKDSVDLRGKIGIITPYKSQLRELKDRFARQYGDTVFEYVEFNTTDAYQGRESEIIIFSCVRASPAGGIGFLQDIRRMNVGLTRAKSSLWVLGNSQSLMRGQFWKLLVEDAQKRERYTTGDVRGMLRKHSSTFPAPKGHIVDPC